MPSRDSVPSRPALQCDPRSTWAHAKEREAREGWKKGHIWPEKKRVKSGSRRVPANKEDEGGLGRQEC